MISGVASRHPSLADAVSWIAADEATRKLAAQTVEVLDTRDVVQRLAARYAAVSVPHRAGHLFEVMHALSFNREAIDQESPLRAKVTEWAAGGSQRAVADIQIVGRDGHGVMDVQAKLYDNVPSLAHELGRASYVGMQRVVPADRLDQVQDLFARRLDLNRDGLNVSGYADAHEHTASQIVANGVTSEPVNLSAAHQAAENPLAWINGLAGAAFAQQLLAGVGAAGLAAGTVGCLISAAGSTAQVLSGRMTPAEAAVASGSAAVSSAIRAAGAAGIGGVLTIGAQLGHLSAGLAGGTLPMAIGRATVAIAEHGYDLARGEINAAEFAARSTDAALRTTVAWAFSSVGQTLIPVPVAGALVGALVGQVVAIGCAKGLQAVIAAARAQGLDEQRVRMLEQEAMVSVALIEAQTAHIAWLGEQHNVYVRDIVNPQLAAARAALLTEDDDEVVTRFAEIVEVHGDVPWFRSMTEFDQWMADDEPVLLDPNWR